MQDPLFLYVFGGSDIICFAKVSSPTSKHGMFFSQLHPLLAIKVDPVESNRLGQLSPAEI